MDNFLMQHLQHTIFQHFSFTMTTLPWSDLHVTELTNQKLEGLRQMYGNPKGTFNSLLCLNCAEKI